MSQYKAIRQEDGFVLDEGDLDSLVEDDGQVCIDQGSMLAEQLDFLGYDLVGEYDEDTGDTRYLLPDGLVESIDWEGGDYDPSL